MIRAISYFLAIVVCTIIASTIQKCNTPVNKTFVPNIEVKQNTAQNNIEESTRSFLEFYNRKWTIEKSRKFIDIMKIGEKETGINPTFILYLIALESEFKTKAHRHNKDRKKTIDYGLTQQNSMYIKERYKCASKVLDKYNIKYNINDKYDMGLNIIAAFIYTKDILNHERIKTIEDTVGAYNVGVVGLDMETKQKQKDSYLARFYGLVNKKIIL